MGRDEIYYVVVGCVSLLIANWLKTIVMNNHLQEDDFSKTSQVQ
jgi:hypothetical protein